MNGERDTIHQAVRDLNRVNGKRSDLEALAGTHFAQVGVVQELMFVQFVFDIGQGELGGPDGNVQLAQNPGQSADMVFMAVREDDAADMLAVLNEVGNVGNNDVDAEQFC